MSDWYQIQSNSLIVQITTKGAEMKRLFSREWLRELLWAGDEKVWNRSAPVLFPIVGQLKDGEYLLHDKVFRMPQHGFARDFEFECLECGAMEAEFQLKSTAETFKMYPFCFELKVRYKIDENKLNIYYVVKNTDRQDIFFSIGAHPAFETKNISDYQIHFAKEEKEYFTLKNGLINWSKPYELNANKMMIVKSSFREDALIFKRIKSKYIDLVNVKQGEVIRLHANTPYWGIWGKKEEVPFVCIEPWHGIADTTDHDKNLKKKEGIICLKEGMSFEFSYSIEAIGVSI